MTASLLRYVVAILVIGFGLVWSGEISPSSTSSFISTAEAVRGRPATPVSYAGVARRTTRRAVAVTSP